MDERENESHHEVVPVTGVAACSAIQRVSAAMQIEPGLWTFGTHVRFTRSRGAEVSLHGDRYTDVDAMRSLLGLSRKPFKVRDLGDMDGIHVVVVSWHNGAEGFDGGVEVIWFTAWHNAFAVLGSTMTALLDGLPI